MIWELQSNSEKNMIYSVWSDSKCFPKKVMRIISIKGRTNRADFL